MLLFIFINVPHLITVEITDIIVRLIMFYNCLSSHGNSFEIFTFK